MLSVNINEVIGLAAAYLLFGVGTSLLIYALATAIRIVSTRHGR